MAHTFKMDETVIPLLHAVGEDPNSLKLLREIPKDPSRRAQFGAHLAHRFLPSAAQDREPEQHYRMFTQWCKRYNSELSSELSRCVRKIATAKKDASRKKQNFVASARLNWGPDKKKKFIDSLTNYHVIPPQTPYPPPNRFAGDSGTTSCANRFFVDRRQMSDKRTKRKKIHPIDEEDLKLDLKPDESGLIYAKRRKNQKEEELVGVVIRNACPNKQAVESIDKTIADAIEFYTTCRVSKKHSICYYKCLKIICLCLQKDDTGILVQNGVTTGSRNCPAFHWAKNIRDRSAHENDASEMHYRCSAAFALFWNLCKSVVPDEIIKDFVTYLRELGIGRMDGDGVMACDDEGKGSYKVEIETGPDKERRVFEFKNVDLAPPTGVSGENYAR